MFISVVHIDVYQQLSVVLPNYPIFFMMSRHCWVFPAASPTRCDYAICLLSDGGMLGVRIHGLRHFMIADLRVGREKAW